MCLGAHSVGETPVPIPNTAVKPGSADGSVAQRHARVGRCQDSVLMSIDFHPREVYFTVPLFMGRKFHGKRVGNPSEELRKAFERDATAVLCDPKEAEAIAELILQMNSAMRRLFKCSALRESFARAGQYILESNCQKPSAGWEQAIAETITPFVFSKVAERSGKSVEAIRDGYRKHLSGAKV